MFALRGVYAAYILRVEVYRFVSFCVYIALKWREGSKGDRVLIIALSRPVDQEICIVALIRDPECIKIPKVTDVIEMGKRSMALVILIALISIRSC
jgi:hypothetical protein